MNCSIAAFTCDFEDLFAFTIDPRTPVTISRREETLSLRTTVEFQGSGAIALLPLKLPITVDFFATAIGVSQDLELGRATLTTETNTLRYQPTLVVPDVTCRSLFLPDKVYQITALLRIGAPNHPALITGVLSGLMLQVYEL